METIKFLDNDGTFSINQAENYSGLYFPIAGEKGIRSSLSPNLGGDIKANQNAFLLEPVSIENLHNNRSGRNFWCHVKGKGAWSAVGASAEEESKKFGANQDKSILTAGLMWQTVTRESEKYMLNASITSFVPLEHNVEIMHIEICNTSNSSQEITPIAAIPIFGRSADNIRDHRHVTSLLHRIQTTDYGVCVKPTLSFDERGHKENNLTYFVCGVTGTGEKPMDFYPVAETYIGEGGSYTQPRKVIKNEDGIKSGAYLEGKEAVGGIRFPTIILNPAESSSYTIIMGITENEDEITEIIAAYKTKIQVVNAQTQTKNYWQDKVNVRYYTGNKRFDNLMRWISFQPILRRIYGCSFLPHHDYGRGGRGWRDLWQDCLSLLIMNPSEVRQMIISNYGGVRIDGTNATIIGEHQGEFIADRNGIARVWMDHGVWPFMTTKLYIDQTGDIEILEHKVTYFKDKQTQRGNALDNQWDNLYGLFQKCTDGNVYTGSILEHLLLQHLCAFYEVGMHNHIRLRDADWNDALDMASAHGESVAFTCAYAGNLAQLAELLTVLENKCGIHQIELLEEIQILLQDDNKLYDSIEQKQETLQHYLMLCKHNINGNKIHISVEQLSENLRHKSNWIMEHIRKTEWLEGIEHEGWFNSYYDNDGVQVEGIFEQNVKMMLTGQVFAIMSGTAKDEQIAKICKSADHYLYKQEIGGYRLNTNFHELRFNLGRMFGFAYGEKENGAVFSHMTVMYANALYKRGFVKEGYKALQTLADTSLNFEVSKIYPSIPEYFNSDGRGLYNYLTGAGSWYMLTITMEVFGICGKCGDMTICPKLLKEQFDTEGSASIQISFAGKEFNITYINPQKLTYGEYIVKKAVCDKDLILSNNNSCVFIDRETILSMSDMKHDIVIELAKS